MPPQQRAMLRDLAEEEFQEDDDGFVPASSSKPNHAPSRRSSFSEDQNEGSHRQEESELDSGRHTQHVPGRLSDDGGTVDVDIFSAEAMSTPILSIVKSSDNLDEVPDQLQSSQVDPGRHSEQLQVDNRSSSTTVDADGNPRDLMGILDDLERELHSGRSQGVPPEVSRTQRRCAEQEEEKHDDGPTRRPTNVEQHRSSLQMEAINEDKEVDGAQSFLANVAMDCVNVCEQVNTQTSIDVQHNVPSTSACHSQRTLMLMDDGFPNI